uniref:CUB domain-containing protein n=1 Tax=Meloidogyne javanica TaxID=6303 RepID=A0A915LLY2_MELJA
MLYYNPVFFLLLLHLLISIIFAESLAAGTTEISENNNDCSCPTEEIFVSNLKEGAFKSPGFPDKYCGFLDCKWYIQPEENTFVQAELVSFETEKIHDTLDVYHTRMNGSKLIKVKQASLSGERYDNPVEHLYLSSSINGGLYFHFVTDGINHNHSGFEINIYYSFPCPQPFYFATNSPQRLPAFSLRFIDSCIFSINSTQGIKLTINRFNMTSKFGLKVFETESFPKRYLEHQAGQLAKIEKYSFFNSYPLNVTSRTESVSILITSYDFEDNIVVPYEIEFVAAEKACKCFPNNLIVSRTQPLNLLSPGFPLGYCDNLNCSTQISLENPLNTNDYVESLQIHFDGFWNLNSFTVDSPKVILNFTTDAVGLDTGFNFTIKYIKRNKECLCHGSNSNLKILDGTKNSIQNNFDSEKCRFMDCLWKIEHPKDSKFYHRILLKFNVSLDDSKEFVHVCPIKFLGTAECYIIDFVNKRFKHEIELFVHKLPRLPLISNRDSPVYVWYHRDYSPLNYDVLPTSYTRRDPNIPRQINFTYEWKERCKCGNAHLKAYENYWNVLYSPDYPETYCHSMDCLWHLEAPEGYHIVVNISEFYTEEFHDFLTIYGGNDINQKHMKMLIFI